MSRISIYVIKEISSSFLFIFSLITIVVWLSQALRNVELLSNDSVTIASYIFYTILLIPKLSMITIPISIQEHTTSLEMGSTKIVTDKTLVQHRSITMEMRTFSMAQPHFIKDIMIAT